MNFSQNKSVSRKRAGFTLIELLVVMFIIATLTAIGFGVFSSVQEGAKENTTRVLLDEIASNMEARQATGLTAKQKDKVEITGVLIYPEGDGTDDSTINLALYLSGDFNDDGLLDELDGLLDELDRLDTTGNSVVPIMSKFLKKDPSFSNIDSKGRIVDAWRKPIRYVHKDESGVASGEYNNFDDSFDLLSAGADGEFDTADDIRK